MTFHFMTGLWLEDMKTGDHRIILITETGVDASPMCRAPAGGEGLGRDKPSPSLTVDFDRNGVQHGFLRLPYSRDDSA